METAMRILIAEDDQVLADGLVCGRCVLPDMRSIRWQRQRGRRALSSHEFDLVILDLGLPKMHGFDVLRKLRAAPAPACRC
jgi:two-component system OmpR family response regulator